jgi:hypothetical protein
VLAKREIAVRTRQRVNELHRLSSEYSCNPHSCVCQQNRSRPSLVLLKAPTTGDKQKRRDEPARSCESVNWRKQLNAKMAVERQPPSDEVKSNLKKPPTTQDVPCDDDPSSKVIG